ncbi:MAG: heavy metal-associated domain-containing protein [Planctomycetota bacterium]
MKAIGILLLAAAGGLLLWIGLRADDPSYEAPEAYVEPEAVPAELEGAVPAGFVVQTFDVEGICCEGCGSKLFASLSSADGVHAAAVNTTRGVARAVVPVAADPQTLVDALTFDKYTATARL